MTGTLVLSIVDPTHPGRPPLTMNQWRNAHWSVKTTAKHRVAFQVRGQLSHNPPVFDRISVAIAQYAPDNRRRDVDGLSVFRKDVCDAIVRCGVVLDDSAEFVVDAGNTIHTDKVNPRIEVIIRELPVNGAAA